jgi:hypothetical protein
MKNFIKNASAICWSVIMKCSYEIVRLRILITSVVVVILAMNLEGQTYDLLDCYVKVRSDTLHVGNRYIHRKWPLKNGYLVSGSENGAATLPDSSIIKTRIVPETACSNSKLVYEYTAYYPHYDKKTVFTLAPEVPAIRLSCSIKKNTGAELPWIDGMYLDRILLPSVHCIIRTVEFFDRTDEHNNLVKKDRMLPFTRPAEKRGNLLIAESSLGSDAFFLLKEAPGADAQAGYPGYDFLIEKQSITVAGTGITQEDLIVGEWINTYSVVFGVPVDNMGCEYSLRLYQKSIRKHVSNRDDMIMLNTWGDRNKDQRVNEEFCIREIDACARFGFTHFQVDDGWQTGLSKNSGNSSGNLWDDWEKEHWEPNPLRFPNGFMPVVRHARGKDISLGLWFHPSTGKDYEYWQRDAEIIAGLFEAYGIRYFKIDGVNIPTKRADINFRKFLDHSMELCHDSLVFNLDVTADIRGGYHYFNEYGTIFLENRYTDWGNYFPHWTLRNLWQLSAYVPPEKIQLEFLNIWRNRHVYVSDDPLAPANIPFDYVFATTMAAQPLAWFEASGLPAAANTVIPLIARYKTIWSDFHQGVILPVGDEPDGTSWTGFQSIHADSGYFLIFRERNPDENCRIKTNLSPGVSVTLKSLCGYGKDFTAKVNHNHEIGFELPGEYTFGLYSYSVGQ